MKIRYGFVSNSSTTSFTVALLGTSDTVGYQIFQTLTTVLSGKIMGFTRRTVKTERAELLEEQKRLTRDKNFGEDELVKLRVIQKDPKLVTAVQQTIMYLSGFKFSRPLRDARNPIKSYRPEVDCVADAIEHLESDVRKAEISLKKNSECLAKFQDLDDTIEIVRWSEDASFGPLKPSMGLLVKEGVLRILEKETK